MYAVTWEHPGGEIYSYGPFLGADEARVWTHKRLAFVDPAKQRVVGYILTAPFEQPDYGSEMRAVGSCYHAGRDADDRAAGFVCVLVVSPTLSFGVGPFPERDAAWRWFLGQRARLDGAQGLILPFLSPGA